MESECCITRATIEYDIKEECGDNASFVWIDPFMALVNLVADHVLTKSN